MRRKIELKAESFIISLFFLRFFFFEGKRKEKLPKTPQGYRKGQVKKYNIVI